MLIREPSLESKSSPVSYISGTGHSMRRISWCYNYNQWYNYKCALLVQMYTIVQRINHRSMSPKF